MELFPVDGQRLKAQLRPADATEEGWGGGVLGETNKGGKRPGVRILDF